MNAPSIALVGQPVENVQVYKLKPGVSLQKAHQTLLQNKDCNDSIGLSTRQGDFLIVGHKLSAKEGDMIRMDNYVGRVKFFENESESSLDVINPLSEKTGRIIEFGALTSAVGMGTTVYQSLFKGAQFTLKQSAQRGLAGFAIGTVFMAGGVIVANTARIVGNQQFDLQSDVYKSLGTPYMPIVKPAVPFTNYVNK